jgi:hypothetical protein
MVVLIRKLSDRRKTPQTKPIRVAVIIPKKAIRIVFNPPTIIARPYVDVEE